MGVKEVLAKNFPTSSSAVIFLLYMTMFVAQGMLVTASRHGATGYTYNTVTVVLLTEGLKLLLSSGVYLRDKTATSLVEEVVRWVKLYSFQSKTLRNRQVLLLYFVPATLYCLYNNLSFLSLSYFDPTSYFMFMQTRLLLTGLIYQILFSKRLSMKQWGSLVLLTIGCMVHARGTASGDASSTVLAASWSVLGVGLVFVFTQVLCSVFAGVYNEYLIKGKGADIDIMIQNVFMYLDSIACNMLLLGVKGDLSTAFTFEALASIANPFVLILIVNNAVLGIVTSLFLKQLNSVLKAFASALEMVFTALLSWPLLGVPLTLHTAAALVAICTAVVIYAQNPVASPTTTSHREPEKASEKV